MNHYLIVTTCVAGLLMLACSTPQGPNETGGMLVGGLAGGLIGSQFGHGTGSVVGAGIGALAGGFAGKTIGANMDQKAAPQPQYKEAPQYYQDNRNTSQYAQPMYDDSYAQPMYNDSYERYSYRY